MTNELAVSPPVQKIYPISFTVENTEFTVYIENDLVYSHNNLFSVPHIHTLHEMYIIFEGDMLISCGSDKKFMLSSNEGCIFPPLLYHHGKPTPSSQTTRLAMKFNFSECKEKNRKIDLYKILNYILNYSMDTVKFEISHDIINDIIIYSKNFDNDFNTIILKNIFTLIFIKIAEQYQKTVSELKDFDFSAVVNPNTGNAEANLRLVQLDFLVNKYANGTITYPEIAQRLYICTKQLSRIITEKYKKTPKVFLFEYKMKRAEFLLRDTDYSIRETAEALGYASSSIFAIMFKKYMNVSPTEYRKRIRTDPDFS